MGKNALQKEITFRVITEEDENLLDWAQSFSRENIAIYDKFNGEQYYTNIDGSIGYKPLRPVEFLYKVLTPNQKILYDKIHATEPKEPNPCPICFDELNNKPHSKTNCGHLFCEPCLIQCAKTDEKCPYCRTKLKSYTIVNGDKEYVCHTIIVTYDFYYKKNKKLQCKEYYNNQNANIQFIKNKGKYMDAKYHVLRV